MYKLILLTATLSLTILTAICAPKNTTRVESMRGEKWWGLYVSDTPHEPFLKPFTANTGKSEHNSLMTSMMISSAGRYIWSNNPIEIVFDGVNFTIGSNYETVEVQKAGKTLREAYLVCCHKNFPPCGTVPSVDIFTNPIYNPLSELGSNHTQAQIIEYAARILREGFPKGTIIIPNGWQSAAASQNFDKEYYPDPKAMINRLHELGFKVMLTVTPFCTASGRSYIASADNNNYLSQDNSKPYLIQTEFGYEVCRNLAIQAEAESFAKEINALKQNYAVDEIRMDYHEVIPTLNADNQQMQQFMAGLTQIAKSTNICEYMPGINAPLTPYVNGIQCNGVQDWQMLKERVNDILSASLAGHLYNRSTPAHDAPSSPNNDQKFMARSLVLTASLPIMSVDFAPWHITDAKLYEQVKSAFRTRESMKSYIAETVAESARTAEPLMRHIEYQFPRNGFSDCDDQYMLGSKYLFAPMLSDSGKRMVRLPRGIWTDANGKRYRGPVVISVGSNDAKMIYFELFSK